jgi:hypothetical protein
MTKKELITSLLDLYTLESDTVTEDGRTAYEVLEDYIEQGINSIIEAT